MHQTLHTLYVTYTVINLNVVTAVSEDHMIHLYGKSNAF